MNATPPSAAVLADISAEIRDLLTAEGVTTPSFLATRITHVVARHLVTH